MGPVVPVLSAIAPYIGTAATLYGAYETYQGAKDSARESEMLTDQQMRDERLRTQAEQAERRARVAASGLQATGSPAQFMREAQKQDQERLRWMKRTGNIRSDAYRSQGRAGALGSLAKIPGYWT